MDHKRGMPLLYVAVICSNQDRNITLGNETEMAHVAPVGVELTNLFNTVPGVKANNIIGTPESHDTYAFQYVRTQQVLAREWLKQFGNVGHKLTINLHTDAGATSHLGYYYRDDEGKVLGALCITNLEKEFKTGKILQDNYSDYIFSVYQPADTMAILLELGSHQNQHDYDYVNKHPKEIALSLRDSVLQYYKIQNDGGEIEDWTEASFYAKWALERIEHKEDPRDGAAFKLHLRSVGKDAGKPRFYGWPCV